MNETEKIAQLTEAIQALTQAVASNERRYQQIEGRFRWMGVGVVALLAVAVLTHFDWVERSHAADPNGNGGCDLMCMLGKAGLDGPKMAKMVAGLEDAAIVMGRVKQDSDLLRAYALSQREPPNPMVQQVLASNPIPVDPALQSTQALLSGNPLSQPTGLNSLDASPSIMVHRGIEHLSVMAGNLRTMAYSMGSTMGRMGSWMP